MEIVTKEIERKILERQFSYISSDGKEFDIKEECEKYEDELKYSKIKHLRIPELDDQIPIHMSADFSEWSHYEWYKLQNQNDIEAFCNYYDEALISTSDSNNFPLIICVETEDDMRSGTPYIYTLEKGIEITKNYFKKFGYEVEIRKE